MRLRVAWSFRLLRRLGSTPFAKLALAESAYSFDANRRLLSSLTAAWLLPAVQQKLPSPGAKEITRMCAVGGHMLRKPSW